MKNKEFEMKRSEVNRDSREMGSPTTSYVVVVVVHKHETTFKIN